MSLLRQIWQLPKTGDISRLQLAGDDLSEPDAGCVTVRVAAVGLNFADVFACLGLYSATPSGAFVPGLEFASCQAARSKLTPAGMLIFVRASIVFELASLISMTLLWVLISNCSRDFLLTWGDRRTV